jgi:hypothetical protein
LLPNIALILSIAGGFAGSPQMRRSRPRTLIPLTQVALHIVF